MSVLGLLLIVVVPFLLVLSAFESGDDDGLGLCFASILAGLVLIAVAGTKDSAWRKELKLAKEHVIKEAGLEAPPRSKTPHLVAGVFAVLSALAPSLAFSYSDVMAGGSFMVALIAVVVVLAQESERNKVVDRNFKAIVEHRGNEQE
jgi:peptidoglycan/LPS O-acetylase OafA/YrhL